MIVEILVAQNEAVDALGEEIGDRAFDEFLNPAILKTLGELLNEATSLFDFTEKKSATAVTGEMAALEVGLDIS